MTFRHQLAASFLGATLLAGTGCSRSNEAPTPTAQEKKPAAPRDLCALLSPAELERILGARPQKSPSSETIGGGFAISQCTFQMSAAIDSISVSVMRSAPGPLGRDPRNLLEERIADYEKRQGGREKDEKEQALDFVPGVGDKALWMGTMVGGNLYVLKGHILIRIAVGSTRDPATRKAKTVELARLLVGRL
ncbi:MAG: hypothetical protein ABIU29_00725 [Chthoniobacterales bacterium]